MQGVRARESGAGTIPIRVVRQRTERGPELRLTGRMDTNWKQGTRWMRRQEGKIGYILAWLIGIPLPILIIVFLLRGCQ